MVSRRDWAGSAGEGAAGCALLHSAFLSERNKCSLILSNCEEVQLGDRKYAADAHPECSPRRGAGWHGENHDQGHCGRGRAERGVHL